MVSFRHLLKCEFGKLFSRRRTIIGFAAFLALELLLLALMQHGAVKGEIRRTVLRLGFSFAESFTGPTIAEFVMSGTMAVLGNLQVAMTAGEIVAKEIEDGTMRMLLCRPISRRRVFGAKLLTCVGFTVLVLGFIALTSLAIGLLYRGPGMWLFLAPSEQLAAQHEFWPGMVRYFTATAFMSLSTCCLATLAFLLSCLQAKPVTAAIGSLAFFLIDNTLRNLPFFAPIKPYFVMSHIVGWMHIYDARIPWDFMLRNSAWLIALELAFVTLGWCAFRRKDLKP